MNAYNDLGDDDVDFNATCDQYDPLKNEPQSIIDMHFVSFDKYVLWLKNREAKLLHKESNVLQQDAPPIPTHAQIQIQNELRYFLDKQTVDKVLKKVYIIFSQDQTADSPLEGRVPRIAHRLGFVIPSKKPALVQALYDALMIKASNDCKEAIAIFKFACEYNATEAIQFNKVNVSEGSRRKAAEKINKPQKSLSYYLSKAPDKESSINILRNLEWDKNKKFPFT